MRPERSRRPALELMVTDLTQAVRSFAESLTPDQRSALLHPLEAAQRTTSRNAAQPPAFCAVLAWCVPGWGLETGALSFEQRRRFEAVMLAAAVRNRHQVIGLLEDRSNPHLVEAAARLLPGRTFADLGQLVAALRASGFEPSAEDQQRPSIGGLNAGAENWRWSAPGSSERWRQFENFAIAIFGRPGDRIWAMRVEGYHLSLNVTILQDGSSWQVHATPLFLGDFPVVLPDSLHRQIEDPLTWQRGQASGLGLVRHMRGFWQAVP